VTCYNTTASLTFVYHCNIDLLQFTIQYINSCPTWRLIFVFCLPTISSEIVETFKQKRIVHYAFPGAHTVGKVIKLACVLKRIHFPNVEDFNSFRYL